MMSTRSLPSRHRQSGQAVLWFLAMVAACCCTFALVYNVGQVTNKKEETINAADASAISGAMVEARMLNYYAYTNRALIANEVTIAQMVSLGSWADYNKEMFYYISLYTKPIPYLNSLTAGVAEVAELLADGIDGVVNAAIPVVKIADTLLKGSRYVVKGVGALAASDVASQVAAANATFDSFDKAAESVDTFKWIVFGANELSWLKFTDTYSGDDRKYGKQAIMNSRDQFSTQRGDGYLLDAINIGLEAAGRLSTLNEQYFAIEKTSGTTDLQQDYGDWAAQDSADLMTYTNDCIIICGFDKDFVDPSPTIAYGRADATNNGVGDDLCYYKPTTTNCTLAVQNSNDISWTGMPEIWDLAKGLAKDDACSTQNGSDGPSLSFMSAVQKSGDSTLTTARMGIGTPGNDGVPQMTDNLQNGDKLTSIAAACTFFLRPDLNANDRTQGALARTDGVHEFASLYNPYWQARLGVPTTAMTTTLYALIGQPGLNFITN